MIAASLTSCVTTIKVNPSSRAMRRTSRWSALLVNEVERRKGLVEQQSLGRKREAARKCGALLLAAGKVLNVPLSKLAQFDELQKFVDPPRCLALPSREAQAKSNIRSHGQPGKQRGLLEHHDPARGWCPDRFAVDTHLPGGGPHEAGNDMKQRGLAAAGSPD